MEDSARPTPADSGELPNGAGMAEDAVVAPDAAEAPEEGEESGIANDSETNAALGAEGEPSRPLTMRELLGELKDSGEPSSGRSTLSEGNGIGSAGAERARSVSMLSLWVSTKLFGSRDSGGGGGGRSHWSCAAASQLSLLAQLYTFPQICHLRELRGGTFR